MAKVRRSRGALWLDEFTAYDLVEKWQIQASITLSGADATATPKPTAPGIRGMLKDDPSEVARITTWTYFCKNCQRLIPQLKLAGYHHASENESLTELP